jgi:hypothetical protein
MNNRDLGAKYAAFFGWNIMKMNGSVLWLMS